MQETENGLEDWIRMFVKKAFEGIPRDIADEMIRESVRELYGTLHVDGKWIVDYVRIRIKARKIKDD